MPLATSASADGNTEWTAAFEYDVVGNLIATRDAKGTTITNTYDKAGRVKTRTYSNEPNGISTPAVSYFYDGKGLPAVPQFSKGKLTRVVSSISASENTSFDNFGRVLTSQQITDGRTFVSKYKYNLSGALIEQTYPSGKIVRNFLESDGDLARVVRSGKTYVSDFDYTASGGIKSLRLGNGRFETARFNTRLQLEQLGLGANANDTSLFKLNYEYGELLASGATANTGNITKQTITLPSATFVQTYKYDALDRLKEAKETASNGATNWQQNFDYDRFGNRIQFSQNINGQALAINSQTLPSVDPNTNRFVTGQGFVYDKNGNITDDIDATTQQARRFVFDGENKQIEVRNPNLPATAAPIAKYFYDGDGKRVKKVVVSTNETTIFVYDGMGKLIAEFSTQVNQSPKTRYLTDDHVGTPRIITDAAGTILSRRDFMPYGEELSVGVGSRSEGLKYGADNYDVRQKFTGYQRDTETSLDFAEARMYESRHGRFTAVDPLLASGKSANPQTFNRYVYTSNNPITRVDRNGLDWFVEFELRHNRYYIHPVWRPHNSGGHKWGTSGMKVMQDGTRVHFNARSFAFRDGETGKYGAYDYFEQRSLTNFNTLKEAQEQVASWNRQAAVNFLAGALGSLSLTYELADGTTRLQAETDSEAYQVGQRAGTAGAIVGIFAGGGGLANGVLKVGHAALKGGKILNLSGKGITVIGKFPKYVEEAKRLGANVFDIPTKKWKEMEKAGTAWIENQKFLDDAIARGDDILLSERVTDIEKVSGTFRRELDYLYKKGFHLSEDGRRMIR